MNISGSSLIPATPERVYAALTDPAVLQRVIPGCEKLEQTGDGEYNAHLKLGIASVKGSYTGKVRLSDRQPPHQFTMHLEGKGGPGFVKGKSVIELKAEGQGTRLAYRSDVQVGGLIAAIGSRVIEAASKKLAEDFFKKFSEVLATLK